MGLLGVITSGDNRRIDEAFFFIRGKFEDPVIRMDASAIWEDADPNYVMQINLPTGDDFSFSEGGLYSDFLPSAKVKFQCQKLQHGKEPSTMSPSNYSKAGIGDFALRIIVQIARASSVKKGVMMKYAVLLYPGSISSLTANAGEQGPSWPGIKLSSGEFPMGPRPSVKWGCPVLPFIRISDPLSENSVIPPGETLRRAISNVMARGGVHDGRSNGSSLREKWEKMRRQPEVNTTKEPTITWPPPSPEPKITG